ncbi:MAG: bifunctional 4-hydroxy-2-oxoglutarate aldolase/2-dehydro-3-deoxy-phosphogluconate aldolase [Bacteroidetes bacterium]|nr:bifunctional 4-hydroxy-2-oxoglutarate aldolase/2-dehydro-3-deoxy-phosphogluconate aldolase [Bacteroidota bacterium]
MAHETIQRIADEKLFAVIRVRDTSTIPSFVQKITEAGISIIEVTLNSGGAIECIEELVHRFPKCLIGAGTVIGKKDSEAAIAAGAKFLVSPIVDTKMITVARDNGVPSMAGALTPTEVFHAHTSGADFVKLFPLVGLGPAYVKALRGPLPQIRYVATNGVSPQNVGEYIAVGCTAAGLGSSLISDADIAASDSDAVGKRAATARAMVA